ncbi:MAG: alpha-L-arabinofuranosidase C-terminal domain-containing protein [Sedimentisphaerales bacterium]|nr:alpha-L-arabinofuranosidase C-terminal domain-containing protein [Sedimentisphaerales bacterium]
MIGHLLRGCMVVACLAMAGLKAEEVSLTIHPDRVLNDVDEKVYGHFLEHIYHSCNGGLWGELVWNRSFELDGSGQGRWSVQGDELVQSSLATDVHMEMGDGADWSDYEVTIQARKDGGSEGFLIVFRAVDEDNFYWLNLGGWNNTQHAIEKEVRGNRRIIGAGVPGRIQTGKWYNIRIRCEGNRFQAWLDGQQVLDVTDRDRPYLTGRIGVGTWGTRARYRNIQVKDLAGKTLYTGLPELTEPPFRIDFWETFGNCKASFSSDALNDEKSVQIEAASGGTGLQQHRFRFTSQWYNGSLRMKGSVPAGVKVELLDGANVIGEAVVGAPTDTWAEYPFRIMPTASTFNGSLRITLQGPGSVKIDQVSLLGQDAIDTGGYRPDLLMAVADLRPPIIRWPGGCFASLYLWKDGIGPQHKRHKYPAYMWDDQDNNAYGTDEFLRMCEKIGAQPLLVINTGLLDSACGAMAQFKLDSPSDYLAYALDWMEYCNGDAKTTKWGAVRAANGHPEPYRVRYWEIDNETWAAGSAAYIAAVKRFAPAMRAKAAELGVPILLAACGGNRFDMQWNRALIDACADLIDFVSIHNYEDPDNFDSGVRAYEDLFARLGEYIARSANPDLKIYVSEWNAQSTDWRTGLYAGGLLNAFERQGKYLRIGGPALFLRHTSASGWDNAFINFDHTGWFPAPNYVVMKLWRDHYAPYRIALEGDLGRLNVVATKTEDGRRITLKLVNPTTQAVELTARLASGTVSKTRMEVVAPGDLYARNTLARPNAVRTVEAPVQQASDSVRCTLPALSCAVLDIIPGQ